jgi:hypothetical protein
MKVTPRLIGIVSLAGIGAAFLTNASNGFEVRPGYAFGDCVDMPGEAWAAPACASTVVNEPGVVVVDPGPGVPGTLNPQQIRDAWVRAGGDPSPAVVRWAVAVALAESGGQPGIISKPNSNGTRDHGLWQINDGAWPDRYTTDLARNAEAAVFISKNGTNWGPWNTYPNRARARLGYVDRQLGGGS